LALAWAHCQDGDVSDYRCAGVRGGAELGFSAFWRVTPNLAWGGGFQVAFFRNDPPSRAGTSNAEALAVFLGLMGRAYFLNGGAFDPYVQLGIGGVALGTASEGAPGLDDTERYEETGAGPAVQVGLGADFFLGSRLKLGPSFTYTQVFVDKIRRCRKGESGDCDDVSKSEHGHLNSFLTLGVRLSILLGSDL
jgi:opacity protein-like surface antigen